MPESNQAPIFKSGRDQQISYAEKGDANLTASIVNNDGPVEFSILDDLKGLREIMTRFGDFSYCPCALIEAAESEAKAPKPDRNKLASLVENAVQIVVKANSFSDQADHLIPRLQKIAVWAGRAWDSWAPTMGL